MKRLHYSLLATILSMALLRGVAHAGRITDTEGVVHAILRGAILWDVREGQAYAKGHIPGALNVTKKICAELRTPGTRDYIPMERINQHLADWGIDPAKEVVIYGDKASVCTYFVLVTLELVGAENVKAYHGGVDDWVSAGRPLSSAPALPTPIPLPLRVRPKPRVIVSTDEVIASLKQSHVQILDVRTPKEYLGEDIRSLRGGHIPGAVNIPYEMNWVDPQALIKMAREKVSFKEGLALKPLEQLKQLYAKLDPQKETFVYCQSSPRACVTATILKDLNFRSVRVYDSSWLGYGNRFDAPAENETFFDVFTLTRKLKEMEQRVNNLEMQMEKIKEGK
ncbi:MAG: sulfurtransferase [Thermodesulfobacteriota bacterium]